MASPGEYPRIAMMMGSAATVEILRRHVQNMGEAPKVSIIGGACEECGHIVRDGDAEQNLVALIEEATRATSNQGSKLELVLVDATSKPGPCSEEDSDVGDAFKHEALVCATEIFFLLDASDAPSAWNIDFEADLRVADRIVLSGFIGLDSSELWDVMSHVHGINSEARVVLAEGGLTAMDPLPGGQSDNSALGLVSFLGSSLLLTACPRASRRGAATQRKSRPTCGI
mmetsp:Transcript_27437/g.68868  ORF Transcript_27437/g.68868 Transcript_27437/m.68868 type:complete len:228 (-) Transcript_27437:79-762(-)